MPRTLTMRTRRSPVDVDVARASALALARRIDTVVSRVLRDYPGVTLEQIAAAVRCCTPSILRQWMRGYASPAQEQRADLAAAVGVNYLWLSSYLVTPDMLRVTRPGVLTTKEATC